MNNSASQTYPNPDTTPVSSVVPMYPRELMGTLVTGLVAGLVTGIVYLLLNKYIFGAVLCRSQSIENCGQAPLYAMIIATVVGIIAGVFSLARMRIYRPLMIALAAAVSLWGVHSLFANSAWYMLLIAFALLFMITYGLFAWMARIRSLLLTLVVTVVLVAIIRVVLVA